MHNHLRMPPSFKKWINNGSFILLLFSGVGFATLSTYWEGQVFFSILGFSGIAFVCLAEATKVSSIMAFNPGQVGAGFLKFLKYALVIGCFGLSMFCTFAISKSKLDSPNRTKVQAIDAKRIDDDYARRIDDIRSRFEGRRTTLEQAMEFERVQNGGIGVRFERLARQYDELNAEENKLIRALQNERASALQGIRNKNYGSDRDASNEYIYAVTSMFSGFIGQGASAFLVNMFVAALVSLLSETAIYLTFNSLKQHLLAPDLPEEDEKILYPQGSVVPVFPPGGDGAASDDYMGTLIGAIKDDPSKAATIAEKMVDSQKDVEMERIKTGAERREEQERQAEAEQQAQEEKLKRQQEEDERLQKEEQKIREQAHLERLQAKEKLMTQTELDQEAARLIAETETRSDITDAEKATLAQRVFETTEDIKEGISVSMNGESHEDRS